MNDIQEALNLNLWPLLTVALFGLVCFFIIRLLNRMLVATTAVAPWMVNLKEKWPVLERVFWALFILGSLGALIKPNPLLGGILAILILASTWVFIKNYVSGIIIMAEGGIKVGQSIRFDSYEGKVARLNALNCDIELDDSGKETLKVPYATLASQLVIKTSPSENVVSQISLLEIEKNRDPLLVEGQIENTLINMPWLVAEEGYSIERLDNGEDHYRFRVVLHGIDKKQLKRGAEQLKAVVEAKH